MATRSTISAKCRDGNYRMIYCHWDGYPTGEGSVGATLYEHYQDQEKIEKLLEHGALSELHASCERPEGHSFNSPTDGHSVYYSRDRGEDESQNKASVGSTYAIAMLSGSYRRQAYNYLWEDGRWTVNGKDLELIIKGESDGI